MDGKGLQVAAVLWLTVSLLKTLLQERLPCECTGRGWDGRRAAARLQHIAHGP